MKFLILNFGHADQVIHLLNLFTSSPKTAHFIKMSSICAENKTHYCAGDPHGQVYSYFHFHRK